MNEHIEEYELMNNTHRPTHPKWILPKWKAISAKFTFCAESHTDLESAGRPLASNLIGQARKCKPGLLGKGYWARLPKKWMFEPKLDFLRSFSPFWPAILTFGKIPVATNLKKFKRA